jgi:hypothetical protein
MLHARLRGLLQPDYKYGAVSQGAEKMILTALGAEISAQSLEAQAALSTRVLSELKADSKRETLTQAQDKQHRAARLRRYIFKESGPDTSKRAVDSIVDLFYALERAGIIKDEP